MIEAATTPLNPGMPARSAGTPAQRSRSTTWSRQDRQILARVERYLEAGIDLKRWWEKADAGNSYREVFSLSPAAGARDHSFGFRDLARVSRRPMPVMGNVQEMFYDQPKVPPDGDAGADWLRAQVAEFVLRYFMRTSDFRLPATHRTGGLSPRARPRRGGFGFSQLYYKRRDTGEIGRFRGARRRAIIDLRELEDHYEWVVVRLVIHDFGFTFRPFGAYSPSLSIPMTGTSYLVLSRDFVLDEDQSADDRFAARYGLGYAFLPNLESSVLSYGPGRFDAALQLIRFEISHSGEIWCRMAFVANRPRAVVELDLNPLSWAAKTLVAAAPGLGAGREARRDARGNGSWRQLLEMGRVDVVSRFIEIANSVTGGAADRRLSLSKKQLERLFLSQHFIQHYKTIAGTLATWRQVVDWRDRRNLPARILARSSG